MKKLIVLSVKNKKILAQKEPDIKNNQKKNNRSSKRLINKLKLTPFQIYQNSKNYYLKKKMKNIFDYTNQVTDDSILLDKTNVLDKYLKLLHYQKKEKLNKLVLTNYNPFRISKDAKNFKIDKKEKLKKFHKKEIYNLLTKNVSDTSKNIEIRNMNPNNFSYINYFSVFSNDKIKRHISFFENPNKNLKNLNSNQNLSNLRYLNAYISKSTSLDYSKEDQNKLPKIIENKIRNIYLPLYNIIWKKF